MTKKPTARPPARPRKLPWGLTEAQVADPDPLVILRALLVDAVRRHDADTASGIAAEIYAFEHPTAPAPVSFTEGQLREIVKQVFDALPPSLPRA